MRIADGNPDSNKLNAGVTEDLLMDAVRHSGYPMQASVVAAVVKELASWSEEAGWVAAQEEWTYIDTDSGKTRALDALIESHLWESLTPEQPRVRPVLSLLIECKQSDLPFVFYTRSEERWADYPVTSGFPHDEITLTTDDDPSTYAYPLNWLWRLNEQDFIVKPRAAVSVSALRRRGKSFEVSGEETYSALVLPMMKATDHLQRLTAHQGAHFTDGRLIVSLIVVRAPMVAVAEDGAEGPEHVPWVRIHRYEPLSEAKSWRSHRAAAFDVVHEDYLQTYLDTLRAYVMPFATKVVENQDVLLSGKGFVSGLGHGASPDLVEPRSAATKAISTQLFSESLWQLVTRKVKPYGTYLRPPLRAKVEPDEES